MYSKNNVTMISDLPDLETLENDRPNVTKYIRNNTKNFQPESGMNSDEQYHKKYLTDLGNDNYIDENTDQNIYFDIYQNNNTGHNNNNNNNNNTGHNNNNHTGHNNNNNHTYHNNIIRNTNQNNHTGHNNNNNHTGHNNIIRNTNQKKYKNYEMINNSKDGFFYPKLSCLDINSHIVKCPICSKFFKPNVTIYIIIIAVLIIICLLMLKKCLNV